MNSWEMKRWVGVLGFAVSVVIVTVATHQAAFAQIGPDPRTNARHSRIVGIWDVEVVVDDCFGGTVAEFRGLHKYELGGTGQVVPATNPVGLSEHSMIWSHVRGNEYRVAVKMFRFENGVNVGWIVINNEVSINEAADEYVGSGVARIYNSAGVQVGQSCPSFIGTRFTG